MLTRPGANKGPGFDPAPYDEPEKGQPFTLTSLLEVSQQVMSTLIAQRETASPSL